AADHGQSDRLPPGASPLQRHRPAAYRHERRRLQAEAPRPQFALSAFEYSFLSLRRLADDIGVTILFQFKRQFLAARLHDAALRQNVNRIGYDVVEQALVVGDHDDRAIRRTQSIHTFSNDPQGVDVEAGVRLVQHAE